MIILDGQKGSVESVKFFNEFPAHSFSRAGSYKIKRIYTLYGGMNVTCTIDVNIRSCVGSMYILYSCCSLSKTLR